MRRTEVGVSGEQLPLRLRQETRVPQERPLHRTVASDAGRQGQRHRRQRPRHLLGSVATSDAFACFLSFVLRTLARVNVLSSVI